MQLNKPRTFALVVGFLFLASMVGQSFFRFSLVFMQNLSPGKDLYVLKENKSPLLKEPNGTNKDPLSTDKITDNSNLEGNTNKLSKSDRNPIYTKYWCPHQSMVSSLQAPSCWFENICFIDFEWRTFGPEAAEFKSYTLNRGTKNISFTTKNYPLSAENYFIEFNVKFDPTDIGGSRKNKIPASGEKQKITAEHFQPNTTFAFFKPFNNFLFSIFHLSGLYATINDHGGMDQPHQYLRINNYLKSHHGSSGVRDLKIAFDNDTNLLFPAKQAQKTFNGQCFKKLVVGDMGKLIESIIHPPNDLINLEPNYDFLEGSDKIMEDFKTYILKKFNLFDVTPHHFRSNYTQKDDRYQEGEKLDPFFSPSIFQIMSRLNISQTEGKPLAVIVDRGLKRAMLNQDDVADLIQAFGFNVAVVKFEKCSIQEQILLSRLAAFFVGVHGAGLTNFIWAKRDDSVLLEIFPFGFKKFTYQVLSSNLGLRWLSWENTNRTNARESKYTDRFEKDSRDYFRNYDTIVDLQEIKLKIKEAVDILKIQYPELKSDI